MNSSSSNHFNFRHLSPGYLGLSNGPATLASRFYQTFIPDYRTKISDRLRSFPQRVPVPGFFEELAEAEIPEFAISLDRLRADLLADLMKFRSVGESNAIEFCNLLDLAARIGSLAQIADFETSVVATGPVSYLAAQKLETYRDAHRRSRGQAVDFSAMQALARACPHDFVRGVIIARLFVVAARYDRSRLSDDLHAEALEFALAARPTNDLERTWLSMIFRALPMAQNTPAARAREWMSRSLEHASLVGAPILRDELLFTTHLSVAKMHLGLNERDEGQRALEKMIELDPLDSIGHSELALFFHRMGRPAEALPSFERAFALGPPSYAMNAFFAADCLLALGRATEAKVYLNASAVADPFGLSPRLKLLEVLELERDREGARHVAREIMESVELRDQLEPDELRLVQNA